jgi:peptide/nickel transport system substrate-binding protein
MKLRTALLGAVAALALRAAAWAERGADGNVNAHLLAGPSILNPYLSGGTKDVAARMVLEAAGGL